MSETSSKCGKEFFNYSSDIKVSKDKNAVPNHSTILPTSTKEIKVYFKHFVYKNFAVLHATWCKNVEEKAHRNRLRPNLNRIGEHRHRQRHRQCPCLCPSLRPRPCLCQNRDLRPHQCPCPCQNLRLHLNLNILSCPSLRPSPCRIDDHRQCHRQCPCPCRNLRLRLNIRPCPSLRQKSLILLNLKCAIMHQIFRLCINHVICLLYSVAKAKLSLSSEIIISVCHYPIKHTPSLCSSLSFSKLELFLSNRNTPVWGKKDPTFCRNFLLNYFLLNDLLNVSDNYNNNCTSIFSCKNKTLFDNKKFTKSTLTILNVLTASDTFSLFLTPKRISFYPGVILTLTFSQDNITYSGHCFTNPSLKVNVINRGSLNIADLSHYTNFSLCSRKILHRHLNIHYRTTIPYLSINPEILHKTSQYPYSSSKNEMYSCKILLNKPQDNSTKILWGQIKRSNDVAKLSSR